MAAWTFIESNLSDGLPMRVYLAAHEDKVWAAALTDRTHPKTEAEFEWRAGDGMRWTEAKGKQAAGVLAEAVDQIRDYLGGRRFEFNVPLQLRGTVFQVCVWRQLMRIPFGSVQSYGEIAAAIGNGGASRAVGNANGRNHIPLFIPCHRVIAAGGKLGGFTGGLGLKKRLLAHEAAVLGRHPESNLALAAHTHGTVRQAAAQV